MSSGRPTDEQPEPKPTESPAIWDLVIEDMRARDRLGRERYGVPLQCHNGREALVDLYEELLDAVAYTRQAVEEGRQLREEVERLRGTLAGAYRKGQEDMRSRAANCTGFDVYNISYCIRCDILALEIRDAAPDVPAGSTSDP